MNDVETRLRTLATHAAVAPHAGEDTVRADLARGRRARRRRSVRLAGTALALVAVAGVGTAVIVSGQAGDPAPAEQQRAQPEAPGEARSEPPRTEGLRLVAWNGEQLPGFEVARVPEGFVLEGATPLSLTVARAGDTSGVDVFADKVAVMLESADATGAPQGDPVEVGDKQGWLRQADGGTWVLTVLDGEHRVVVQAWGSLGLTGEQVVEFARGVTVTSDAVPGRG